jgi:hypothetical protein
MLLQGMCLRLFEQRRADGAHAVMMQQQQQQR